MPQTNSYPLYYLAEWRNYSGFDRGLKYPYVTVYNNEATTEWQVDRTPYTAPGMLLWIRNAAYDFDYTLGDASLYEPPSYGPKHALLVVDSHFWPLEWDGMGTSEAHLRLNSRAQPSNATFTLQPTTSFTVRRADAVIGDVLETKTFASLPRRLAVPRLVRLLPRPTVSAGHGRSVLLGLAGQRSHPGQGRVQHQDHRR